MHKRRPEQDFTGTRLHPVFGVDLAIGLDRRHIGLAARIKEGDCPRRAIGPTRQVNSSFRHRHIIGAGKPAVRMIVQVMVITKAVDVGPALQMPVDLVVDPAVFDITHQSG